MQRRRVEGAPEAVFAALQERLRELEAMPRLVDPASITLLFDYDVTRRGRNHTFFLAVVPIDDTHSDVALARKRKGPKEDLHAMVVGGEDPTEAAVVNLLVQGLRG